MNRISGLLLADVTPARRMACLMNHVTSAARPASSPDRFPTAGIIVIGDEILKGQTTDTNSAFLSRRLYAIGVRVQKISVIADDLDVIAQEVSEFSRKFTHVLTSGGIGPTHDDLTFEGVARAFGERVSPHPELVALCKEFFGTDDLKSPKLKLAFVPESSELCYGVDKTTGAPGRYPVVRVRNVFVFPGIPKLLTTAFDRLDHMFRNPDTEFFTKEIYIRVDEASITGVLNDANVKFKDNVVMGSYPEFYNSYYKVKLCLESMSRSDLDDMYSFLCKNLPADSILDYEKDPILQAASRVYALAAADSEDDRFAGKIRKSLSIVEDCFNRYGADEVCVGFNGGKDCTALLHLVHAVATARAAVQPRQLTGLYIRHGQPFPEVELFISRCRESYNLDLVSVAGRIKDALGELRKLHPRLKVVLMGTRITDPRSDRLQAFSPTDVGWPEYMRVNPLLDWTHADLWAFMRRLSLPYCPLYDRGYTSLGSMENTHPNPGLRVVDSRGVVSYRPAYTLAEGQDERAGRN